MTSEQRAKIEAKINDIELMASEYAVGYHSVEILLSVVQELFDEIDALTRFKETVQQSCIACGAHMLLICGECTKRDREKMEAENARLAAELASTQEQRDKWNELATQRKADVVALRKYARHIGNCRSLVPRMESGPEPFSCDCGVERILAETAP